MLKTKRKFMLQFAAITLSAMLVAPSITYAEDIDVDIGVNLNIDITDGGYVVLNQGLDDELTVRTTIVNGERDVYVYDSEHALVQISTDVYAYQSLYDDIVTVNIIADDGYEIDYVDYTADTFDDCILPTDDYLFVATMIDDSDLTVSFAKKEEDVITDSVSEQYTDISIESNNQVYNTSQIISDDEVSISSEMAKKFSLYIKYDDTIINDIRNKLGNSSITCNISYYDESWNEIDNSSLIKQKKIQLNSLLYGYYFGNDFNNMLNNARNVAYVKIRVLLDNQFYVFSANGAELDGDNNKATFTLVKRNISAGESVTIAKDSKTYTYKVIGENDKYSLSGPLGLATNFHIVGFTDVKNNVHTNGNILTNKLYYGSNFGTNGYFGEISYIRSFGNSTEMTCGDSSDDILVVGSDVDVDFDGDYFYINGKKINTPCNVYKDSSDSKYIDIEQLKVSLCGLSSSFAKKVNKDVEIGVTQNNFPIVTVSGNDMAVWNVDYDDLKSADSVTINGISNNSASSLLINVRVDSSESNVRIPGLILQNVDASSGEVVDFSAGKIIWNIVYDDGQCYTGDAFNDRQSGGTVLVPSGRFDSRANWNGSMIADSVTINAESHRTDFTGTSGGFSIKKTLKGKDWKMGDLFTFQLSAELGTPMPNDSYIAGSSVIATVQASYSNKTPAFESITYVDEGVYEYVLSELAGTDDECSYDDTVYKIKVVVTKENEMFSLDVRYSIDNGTTWNDSSMIYEFTNLYGEEIKEDFVKNTVDIDISSDKDIYDINAGEVSPVFTIKPSTVIHDSCENIIDKDNLKITITLPKNLDVNDSDISIAPNEIKKNDDGTTTITWNINDVNVGESIDDIKIATILNDNVKDKDSFIIKADITSDNDNIGGHSEVSISVTKDDKDFASFIEQMIMTPLVEAGSDIKFKLTYSNISEVEAANVKICDILPYDEDERGSSFNGEYKLKSLVIDFSNAKDTFDKVKDSVSFYTSSDDVQNDINDKITTDDVYEMFKKQSDGVINISDFTMEWNDINQDVSSFLLYLSSVSKNENIDIYVTITPSDKNQKSGDSYCNDFIQYSDNIDSAAKSNDASASVVKRDLSGMVWIDKDGNGTRENTEDILSNVMVKLYRMNDSSSHDNEKNASLIGSEYIVYDAYDVYGDKLTPKTTDENGYYEFNNIESGSYLLSFGINDYHTTDKNVGDDTTIDSDAHDTLNEVVIADIKMPAVNDMKDWSFKSTYNDVGLLEDNVVEVAKIDSDTSQLLECAELAIYNYADTTNNVPNTDAVPVVKWTTTNEVKILSNILVKNNKYVLIEEKAPEGYTKAEPIVFTVSGDTSQRITLKNSRGTYRIKIAKRNRDGELIKDAELKITGRENGSAEDITPITFVTKEANIYVVELNSGSYTLHEESAPAGYLKSDDVHFTIDSNGNIFIAGSKVDEVEMIDTEVKACSIKIKKYDSDGKSVLPGVTFSLKFVSAKYLDITNNSDYDRALKPGESVEMTTDINGEVLFENLDQGDYILTETKTISGHTLMSESISISLPLEMTEKEIKESDGIDVKKAEIFDDIYHFYNLTYEVTNSARFVMPMTGTDGILKFGLIGFGTLAALGTGLVVCESMDKKQKRRRKRHK